MKNGAKAKKGSEMVELNPWFLLQEMKPKRKNVMKSHP